MGSMGNTMRMSIMKVIIVTRLWARTMTIMALHKAYDERHGTASKKWDLKLRLPYLEVEKLGENGKAPQGRILRNIESAR